jgi:hypothetical protein
MLPVTALKTVQTNLTTSEETSWWFAKGFGLVRTEKNLPSIGLARMHKTFYNILREDDPLRDPPLIRSASTEWFPFVGPDYFPAEGKTDYSRMDYSYQFDYQEVASFDSSVVIEPTSTPLPLPPDPTSTPVLPTPSATPVGFGRPSEGGIIVPTSTPVGSGGGDGNYPPNDPRISNLMAEDDVVDEKDLLIFLQHWHRTVD